MPNLQDDKVTYWTNYYAARPKSVQVMAERSGKYIHHITKELERRNMPTELALLPFVESAYNATAVSSAKAAGLWQFIPSTGTHYNLAQDWWKDERRDPIESTNAALNYLSYLHSFQGNDWHLALASYNWGEGAVKRARDRNAQAGQGTDYLSLKMPKETRDYVPKLMAIKHIIANPAKYGVNLPHVPDQPYFEVVRQTQDIDVDVAARLAEISVDDFRELNPSSKRQVLLGEHNPRILLPKKKVATFKKNLSNYKGSLSAWKGYTPEPGESLASIANKYGISLEKLKSLNGYGSKQNVALSSRTLMVPRSTGQGITPSASPSGLVPSRDIIAPAINNSTPAMLASNTGVTGSAGMAAASAAMPGQQNAAPVPSLASALRPAVASTGADPLADIIYKNSNNQALAANVRAVPAAVTGSASAVPGVTARPAAYSRSTTAVAVKESKKPVARTASLGKSGKTTAKAKVITHKIVKGDTLYSLAKRYNTSVKDLQALNNLGKEPLKLGASLRIPGSGARG
ncbi:MAG: transglycosylase SLT domain-containing protein [Alcaligenaceae bacterium]|nr:transglycosylase SLT domain-containing protein [Alcaligenaceae bacterium]